MKLAALTVCLLISTLALAEYRVPTVDDPRSSPPTLYGTVIDISGNIVVVDRGGEQLSVLTNRATHIFTGYGGIVYLNEICKASPIEVWYRDPEVNLRIAYARSIRLSRSC